MNIISETLPINNENILPQDVSKIKQPATTRSARRNGLYLTNKEINEYNLARNKFGAQLSLNDIVTSSNNDITNNVLNFTIHEDSNDLLEQDEDGEELASTLSNNSTSTINKRSSIPYVNNRFSSTSSYNGSSVRNSKRFSVISMSSSDEDDDMNNQDDEDFNRCFFNNPNGRTRNLTTISVHSNSSNESIGFRNSAGGKPGLVGYDATTALTKKQSKPKKNKQQPLPTHHYSSASQQRAKNKRHSLISNASSSEYKPQQRYSQISSTSSDRSSKRLSLMGSLRLNNSSQHEVTKPPAEIKPFVAQQQQPKPHDQQSISQPSSSRIHRLMHSVSIRSGLFKIKDPNQPEEKKVQMKRSFFSIRSGLNRSASTLDINIDRNNISLPVPQDQTLKKIDNKLKNSSSIYSLVNRK